MKMYLNESPSFIKRGQGRFLNERALERHETTEKPPNKEAETAHELGHLMLEPLI
jgi:hypothetical protein